MYNVYVFIVDCIYNPLLVSEDVAVIVLDEASVSYQTIQRLSTIDRP